MSVLSQTKKHATTVQNIIYASSEHVSSLPPELKRLEIYFFVSQNMPQLIIAAIATIVKVAD